jgi:hypothetical protein
MSAWLNEVWKSGQANNGGIVRRSVATVEKHASRAILEREVRKRGFHLARIGNQYVILCEPKGRIEIIC